MPPNCVQGACFSPCAWPSSWTNVSALPSSPKPSPVLTRSSAGCEPTWFTVSPAMQPPLQNAANEGAGAMRP